MILGRGRSGASQWLTGFYFARMHGSPFSRQFGASLAGWIEHTEIHPY
jgi:hypothetical protein